ncbi:MAG: DNA primase [Gammaproteobacteria bacterium]|jgi:DNA primase
MAGKIPRLFIDDLLNRVDIVEVIDARVPLKRKGKEYWACCPFHGEKSASFSVSQNKQFYHCFGCQQSGNAISFLMEYDHMEFVEAIETLAQIIGLEVPYEQGQAPSAPTHSFEPLYESLEQCSNYFQSQLKLNPLAIEYLKQRGISGDIARDFAIGFAPKGWNNLTGNKKTLTEAGMLIEKDNGQPYDRFRHRLMFPIRDRRGRTIAFGGRVIDPEDNPKYLNSPESPVFHKGSEIYGLFELKKGTNNIDHILITEGYMDVIGLAQHGVKTAVATLGTAINNEQIEKLFRSSKSLIFCFDGDNAGKKAAWRSLEQCLTSLKEGRIARFLFLPEGHDPDSYIQEFGQQAYLGEIDKAATLSEFLFDTLTAECDISSPEGKAMLLDRLDPYVKQIPLQSLKDQILSRAEGLTSDKHEARLQKLLSRSNNNHETRILPPEQTWTPTRLAINLLLQKPTLARGLGNQYELSETKIPGIDLLLKILDRIQDEPEISTQNLLQRFQGDAHESHLYQLAAMRPQIEDEASLDKMFQDCLNRLQKEYIKYRRNLLIKKLQTNGSISESEKTELKQLFTIQ